MQVNITGVGWERVMEGGIDTVNLMGCPVIGAGAVNGSGWSHRNFLHYSSLYHVQ